MSEETKGGRVMPLTGVRVLDLSRVLAGPSSTQNLADLGADVIKVENPVGGDDTRAWGTLVAPQQSTYYLSANRGKRGIAVDLSTKDGQEIIRELAKTSDVVVENFKLGGLDRYGLDYASLSALNPRLIYCSVSGYGRNGPAAARPGYDFVAQAEAGIMSINGDEGMPPLKVGYAIVDLMTGMYATQAVLAALLARDKTGRGQHIDLALYDCAVAMLSYWATAVMATQKMPPRYGNAHPDVVPYELFPCADGELVVAVGNNLQFGKFCRQVLQQPALADDPRFTTNAERVKHRAALSEMITTVLRTKPRAYWLAALQSAGVPGGEVRNVLEVLTAPETVGRHMVAQVQHPTAGTVGLLASPMRFSDTPVREPSAPPLIGEHTDEVLTERLGLSPQRLAELKAAGTIG